MELDRRARLKAAIEHATHFLPSQGPIKVFIHHNTLHAFEDLPFVEAVREGAKLFGCQPYLGEDRFRQELARGRIRASDLADVVRTDLGPAADAPVLPNTTRAQLRLAMLQFPLRLAPPAELRWFVAETDALSRYRVDVPDTVRKRFIEETRHWVMRDLCDAKRPIRSGQAQAIEESLVNLLRQSGGRSIESWSDAAWEAFSLQALWQVCRGCVPPPKLVAAPRVQRHRDALLKATGRDADRLVHDVLIPFCAAFLDQGMATRPLPGREFGFFHAFGTLHGSQPRSPLPWLAGLQSELHRISQAGMDPLDSIVESLDLLGVPAEEWDSFITVTSLALRGFAGMIHQLEDRPDRAVYPLPAGSLIEFLAVRLILDRLAVTFLSHEALGFAGPLSRLHARLAQLREPSMMSVEQHAFLVFQVAQVLGWLPGALVRLSKQEWNRLVEEIESFSGLERRRVFQLAYERRYRVQTLDAISYQARRPLGQQTKPRFQAVFCIDEREESFRRHLEEVAPDAETLSAAGFFAVAVYYRGIADAHFMPLCPIVIRPQHWIVEEMVEALEESHRRRARTRRALGAASHRMHVVSRTFVWGAIVAAGVGVLSSIPLVARILFPRLTARMRRMVDHHLHPPPSTQLQIERRVETTDRSATDLPGPIGYRVEEMAAVVARLLEDLGVRDRLSRLVFIVGHGSSSLNNPHRSAYDCGACGGGSGGPNARAFAQMANDPRVREILAQRGLVIPRNSHFVGGFHNTCADTITLFDLDRVPPSHQAELRQAQRELNQARERNAHERCRRFESAPLGLSCERALRHVEERSEDLSQARPECGHATNAVCFIGRRCRLRGLFMDRRSFLVAYDESQDTPDHAVLCRIFAAVMPVCAGINLEYYFSYVDPAGWGCGTKLPHNVTSLLGVMDGAASDLRPGLPWQMVEIHEPVRCLFVIEAAPQAMLDLMDKNQEIGRLCRNEWVQIATLDPGSARIQVFRDGQFHPYEPEQSELPVVASSIDWYRGWRDHLGYAVVSGIEPFPAAKGNS